MVTMTVCRRIFDHIMIIVKGAENDKCNGKYYFHHLDEYDSPVFMQDILQNEDQEVDTNANLDQDRVNNNNKDEWYFDNCNDLALSFFMI